MDKMTVNFIRKPPFSDQNKKIRKWEFRSENGNFGNFGILIGDFGNFENFWSECEILDIFDLKIDILCPKIKIFGFLFIFTCTDP